MKAPLDKHRFGPWALVTGASSGLGREFAKQLAAAGLNLVLVSRRKELLEAAGSEFARDYNVEYRVIVADLSGDVLPDALVEATEPLDIGLVVSNAGTPNPGLFLSKERGELAEGFRLNALSHLNVAHHYAKKLVARGRGGLLFVGAMGAGMGAPYMANDSSAKAYVQSLAQALHVELRPRGIHVTVFSPGPTETPALAKLGLTPESMPMRPMKVEPCVREALAAILVNRSLIIPGRLNRIMNAIVPASVTRTMMGKLFSKSLAELPASSATTANKGF